MDEEKATAYYELDPSSIITRHVLDNSKWATLEELDDLDFFTEFIPPLGYTVVNVESTSQQARRDSNEREKNLPPETDGNEEGECLPHMENKKERKLPKEVKNESLLPGKYKKKRKLPELDDDEHNKGSSTMDENSSSQQARDDIEGNKKLRLESEENEAIEDLPHEENKGEKKPPDDDDNE